MVKKRIAIILIALAGFIVIAYFISNYDNLVFDKVICSAIYGIRNEALTTLLTVITYTGNWQTITLICTIMLFFKRTRRIYGYPLSISAIISSFLYTLIKQIIQRPRPDIALHLILQGGFSFPSGHSMTALVFYGMLIYLLHKNTANKKAVQIATVLLCCLIVLIGLSRIYLGVHYPTDVLGGWCLGAAFLTAVILLICIDFRKDTNV